MQYPILESRPLRSPVDGLQIGAAIIRYGPGDRKQRIHALQGVERALDAEPATVQNVGVCHRRTHVFVTQQLLNGSYVIPGVQQMCCKRMPQRMTRRSFRYAARSYSLAQRPLHDSLVQMVAPSLSRVSVRVLPGSRKYRLPLPIPSRTR